MIHINVVILIYSSKPGDSIASIVRKYLRYYGGASYQQVLKHFSDYNKVCSTLHGYLSGSGIYRILPVHSIIKIPDPTGQKNYTALSARLQAPHSIQQVIHHINYQPDTIRHRLSQTFDSGVPLKALAAVGKVVEGLTKLDKKSEIFGTMGIALMEQGSEKFKEDAEGFKHSLTKFNDLIKQYHKTTIAERTPAMRHALITQQKAINEEFADMVEGYSREPMPGGKIHLINDTKNLYSAAKNLGNDFSIVSADELKSIVNIMRYAKYIGRGMIALEIALGGIEVYDAYKEHKDWLKTLVEEVEGFAVGGIAAIVGVDALGGSLIVILIAAPILGVLGGIGGKILASSLWDATNYISGKV